MEERDGRPPREGVLSGPYLQNGTLQAFDLGTFPIPAGTSLRVKGANPARMLLVVYPVSPQTQPVLFPFEPPATLGGVVPTTYPPPAVWHVAAMPGIALSDAWVYSESGGDVRVIEVVTKTLR